MRGASFLNETKCPRKMSLRSQSSYLRSYTPKKIRSTSFADLMAAYKRKRRFSGKKPSSAQQIEPRLLKQKLNKTKLVKRQIRPQIRQFLNNCHAKKRPSLKISRQLSMTVVQKRSRAEQSEQKITCPVIKGASQPKPNRSNQQVISVQLIAQPIAQIKMNRINLVSITVKLGMSLKVSNFYNALLYRLFYQLRAKHSSPQLQSQNKKILSGVHSLSAKLQSAQQRTVLAIENAVALLSIYWEQLFKESGRELAWQNYLLHLGCSLFIVDDEAVDSRFNSDTFQSAKAATSNSKCIYTELQKIGIKLIQMTE